MLDLLQASYIFSVMLKAEFNIGTSVETQKRGIHVLVHHLEKVGQPGSIRRTNTAY